MATPKTDPPTRQHDHEFQIAASPEEVWSAITDAAELVNWFPLGAEVQPGTGGHITLTWGEAFKGTCQIVTWDPPNHLRTSWMADIGPSEGRTQLIVDWYLESERGGTRLRLVHSGFGAGSEWDEEFGGTRRGWDFELYSLKHYLEEHPNQRRQAFWLQKTTPLPGAEVWSRLLGPEGLVRVAGAAEVKAGEPIELEFVTGDNIKGKVLSFTPPIEFACTAEDLNFGLLRAGYENCGGGPVAHLWVSVWDYPEDKLEALKQRLDKAMDRILS
jgi:uncharacterized protein YndB with AHSA1/START domain